MVDTIDLDSDWIYEDDAPAALESLASFRPDDDGGGSQVWLRRSFILEMTDDCVNYVLHLDSAPVGSELWVNGQRVSQITTLPVSLDLTMFVALEENEIAFLVLPDAEGHFAGLRLEPVPCD